MLVPSDDKVERIALSWLVEWMHRELAFCLDISRLLCPPWTKP